MSVDSTLTMESQVPMGDSYEEDALVWPCYILFNESASMSGPKLDAVNQILLTIFNAFLTDPLVHAQVRLGLTSFSDTAEELVPPMSLLNFPALPKASSKSDSNYTAAFSWAKLAIDRDVPKFRSIGFQVLRPFVFFISDGEPTSSGWQTTHAALTSLNYRFAPTILSCGVTGAVGEVIKEVATTLRNGHVCYWLADDGTDLAGVVRKYIGSFSNDW